MSKNYNWLAICLLFIITNFRLFTTHLNKIRKIKIDNSNNIEYLEQHAKVVNEQIDKLRSIWVSRIISAFYFLSNCMKLFQKKAVGESLPHSSTPYRNNVKKRPLNLSSPIGTSIHGTEMNKTYLEENKSDLSIRDISSWLQTKQSFYDEHNGKIRQSWNRSQNIDTQMSNFKELLQKVKDIVDGKLLLSKWLLECF